MKRENVGMFNSEMKFARIAIGKAESLDYKNENIQLQLKIAIGFLKNAMEFAKK